MSEPTAPRLPRLDDIRARLLALQSLDESTPLDTMVAEDIAFLLALVEKQEATVKAAQQFVTETTYLFARHDEEPVEELARRGVDDAVAFRALRAALVEGREP